MNKILKEIKQLIDENLKKYLPDVKSSDLEEKGTIYYMNGNNGTEFDWYVNNHLSDFFVFYNDSKNLGALKLTLYSDGKVTIYIYDNKGKDLKETIESSIASSSKDILDLAIVLKNNADDKRIFNASIDKIDSDTKISLDKTTEFKNAKKYYEKMSVKKEMLNLVALVSAKITKQDYKVGYMIRLKPQNSKDSGWQFLAGNEDDKYLNDLKNISLLPIARVANLDPDILKYIDNPIGSELIRVSSNEFEKDEHNKEIHIEKRKK